MINLLELLLVNGLCLSTSFNKQMSEAKLQTTKYIPAGQSVQEFCCLLGA